jgi:dTDP-4-dehydrorhamnose 3,5-epimerase
MNVTKTELAGLLILEPRVFNDDRGFFLESYNERTMAAAGIHERFVQDNHSFSKHNVVRGVAGEILDVAVDLRCSSPSFGKWCGVTLSGANQRMLWIPAGFGHGFRVVSESAHVLYKATDFYDPHAERTVAWDDPSLKIDWQLTSAPAVSARDRLGTPFQDAEVFE